LLYEVEYYNAASGSEEAIYWVKVPTITGNNANKNMVCMAYGNDPNGTNQDNKTSVWDSHYKIVHHYGNSSTLSVSDSSSAGNSGTITGSIPATTGYVNGAASFPGTSGNHISNSSPTGMDVGTITVSAWIKASSYNNYEGIIERYNTTSGYQGFLLNVNNSHIRLDIQSNSAYNRAIGSVNVTDGNWHFVQGTYDGSNIKVYTDNSQDGSTVGFSGGSPSTGQTLYIGEDPYGNGRYFTGLIDEVRISNVARSADWLKLEYYSMKKTNWNGDGWITWNSEI
jgi:trimeric autotransporter adhesin